MERVSSPSVATDLPGEKFHGRSFHLRARECRTLPTFGTVRNLRDRSLDAIAQDWRVMASAGEYSVVLPKRRRRSGR